MYLVTFMKSPSQKWKRLILKPNLANSIQSSTQSSKRKKKLNERFLNSRNSANTDTLQKMKYSIKGFVRKCDQIHRKLRIWSHLLKQSLSENFFFCAVIPGTNSVVLMQVVRYSGSMIVWIILKKFCYTKMFKICFQKWRSRRVPKKKCSTNMQQIYRRAPMPKCDFNKVVLLLYWNDTLASVFSCKLAAYFQKTFL